MFKKSQLFYEPSNTTEEQRKINEQEWNNPNNWKGYLFPSYSSKLDNRPFVSGRWFFPKAGKKEFNFILGKRTIPNRAHGRGKKWYKLAWLAVMVIILAILKMYLFPPSPSTLNVKGICFKRAGELKQIRDAIKSYMNDCSEYPINLISLVPKYIEKNKLYAFNSSVITKEWALLGSNSTKSKPDRFAYLYFGKNSNGVILSERPGIWEEDSFCKDGINVITDDLGLTIIQKYDLRREQLEQLIEAQIKKESISRNVNQE